MEGYTNVLGSQYDFDDLDIEGRVVDEWNAEDEEKRKPPRNEGIKLLDEQTILAERVKLDNGQQAEVFTVVKQKGHVWYSCHVCSDTVVGLSLLRQHVESNKHRGNMNKPVHPRAKFVKLDPKENLALEPGEPVPPGLEEVIIKTCLIQPTLDACKSSPLIGLEFLVEITQSTLVEGVYYYCLLCDKTGSERNIFIHFTSIFHYMKYLSVYFPTVARKLHSLPNKKIKKGFGLLVTEIVADIEAKYGRMKPHTETHVNFYSPGRKSEIQNAIWEGPHFKEKEGDTFSEKAIPENVEKKLREQQYGSPSIGKHEVAGNDSENTELSASLFNKINRKTADKKQIRSRDDDTHQSSPDVQIVDIQLPKSPEKKKRSRSKSLSSISTISSSSSQSRSRHHHTRMRHSRASHRKWSRSRSRSRSRSLPYRHRRQSPSSYPRKYSPGRRSRDRSPRKYNRGRRNSRGRSPDSYNKYKGVDRYGRSRDKHRSREKASEDKEAPLESSSGEEKVRWAKFREDLKKIETVKLEKLKYYEKNPEKHPHYPEEWKSFWNRRYNELQRSGVDPSKHDFKPEWISFWTKRMKELYEEDLNKAKEELKNKFDLPEDPNNVVHQERGGPWKHTTKKRHNASPGLVDVSPPTPGKKDVIADIKTTWKAFTGSDIKETPKRSLSPWEEDSRTRDSSPPSKRDMRRSSRSLSPQAATDKLLEDMPQRKSRTSSLIFVLRKLTVLEQQLGSLAPRVFEILSQSLALEKIKEDASLDLLFEEENCVFLETVREKIIALLCAGVVPRNIVNTARSAIKHIDIALYIASKRQRVIPVGPSNPAMSVPQPRPNIIPPQYIPHPQPRSEPVVVPGVGQVDKAAIAQQIANALIEQGKTNVTEAELEQLINAVVGMAEASANSAQPMTTANFLHQLQAMQMASQRNMVSQQSMASQQSMVNQQSMASQQSMVNQQSMASQQSMVSQQSMASQQSMVSQQSMASQHLTPTPIPIETTAPVFNPRFEQTNKPEKIPGVVPKPSAFGALKLLQSAYNETAKPEQDSPKRDAIETVSTSSTISDKELAATLAAFNATSEEEQPGFIHKLQTTNPEMYKRLHPFLPIFKVSEPSKRSPITISLSKERSEPKIKPISSGRLSPFSQRSGGANPTIGDRVIIDDDDEEDKSDVKLLGETSNKSQTTKGNQEILKYKFNNSDDDDDDDDDDYSFEDVYKAAQEKLRLKQIDSDKQSNRSPPQQIKTIEVIENDNVKVGKEIHIDQPNQNIPPNSTTWNPNNQDKTLLEEREIFQQRNSNREDLNNQPLAQQSIQHAFKSGEDQFSDVPPQTSDLNLYQPVNPSSSLTYEETLQRRQQYTDSSQPTFEGGLKQNYHNKDQYLNESLYSKSGTEYYDEKSSYDHDLPRAPVKDPYDNQQRAPYATSYRDPYDLSYDSGTNPAYANRMTSYNDQYSYRGYGYEDENYSQSSSRANYPQQGYPNTPAAPQRYPNTNYPY